MEKLVKVAETLKEVSEVAKEATENSQEVINNVNKINNSIQESSVVSEVENNSTNDNAGISIQQITTSKALLWAVLGFTAFLFLLMMFADVFYNKNVSYLMPYAITITTPTIVGYQTKSYLENKNKYSK